MESPSLYADLPPTVGRVLQGLVATMRATLGEDLLSVVLFGSGAEGRLRPTSDVNLIVVLRQFDAAKIDGVRDAVRAAHAAAKVEPMFLLEDEVAAAIEAFAIKFADVSRRHRVLFGSDPFDKRAPSRELEISRLRQVLLNLALRLRERYVMTSLSDEQAALVVADAAGPLRSFSMALLELEGRPVASPKEALSVVASSLPAHHSTAAQDSWARRLSDLSKARERGGLPAGTAGVTLLALVDLALAMRVRAQRLT